MKSVRAAVTAAIALGAIACGPASDVRSTASAEKRASLPVPKPVVGGDYFPDYPSHRAGIIHQYYPVAPPVGDGVWAEPNGIGDFAGLVAQVFQNGTAVDSDGNHWDVDVDSRVYVGEYVGTDGRLAFGAFCEL